MDIIVIGDLKLPGECAHGPFMCRTAPGCAWYYAFCQVPAEQQGSLCAIQDSLMPGAHTEADVPLFLGKQLCG